MMRRFLKGLLPALGLCTLAGQASAQEIQLTGPLAGAPAVRDLRQHRKQRFELAPTVSFTLLDEYQRTILVGARLNYNITDWLAIGVWGAYGVVHSATDLTNQIQSTNTDRFNPKSPSYVQPSPAIAQVGREIVATNVGSNFKSQLGTMNWVIAPQLTAVPFRGKLSIFEKIFIDADLYFFAGPAFVGLTERADCGSGTAINCSQLNSDGTVTTKPTASRVAVAPTFGLGFTFYGGRWFSIGAEYRALPFSWNTGGFDNRGGGPNANFPDGKVDSSDREFKFNQLATISIGFYLPTDLKSSE